VQQNRHRRPTAAAVVIDTENMKRWLCRHASEIGVHIIAALAVVGILYVLRWAPKLGCVLRMPVELPVWLLMAIPLVGAGSWLLDRASQAKKRAREASSFERIRKALEERDKPKTQ